MFQKRQLLLAEGFIREIKGDNSSIPLAIATSICKWHSNQLKLTVAVLNNNGKIQIQCYLDHPDQQKILNIKKYKVLYSCAYDNNTSDEKQTTNRCKIMDKLFSNHYIASMTYRPDFARSNPFDTRKIYNTVKCVGIDHDKFGNENAVIQSQPIQFVVEPWMNNIFHADNLDFDEYNSDPLNNERFTLKRWIDAMNKLDICADKLLCMRMWYFMIENDKKKIIISDDMKERLLSTTSLIKIDDDWNKAMSKLRYNSSRLFEPDY